MQQTAALGVAGTTGLGFYPGRARAQGGGGAGQVQAGGVGGGVGRGGPGGGGGGGGAGLPPTLTIDLHIAIVSLALFTLFFMSRLTFLRSSLIVRRTRLPLTSLVTRSPIDFTFFLRSWYSIYHL